MFSVPPILGFIFLVVYAAFGLAIAVLSGWLSSPIMKTGLGGLTKDLFLGSFGFLAGSSVHIHAVATEHRL
jgi:uncharacterized membrane protein (DUF485 family)